MGISSPLAVPLPVTVATTKGFVRAVPEGSGGSGSIRRHNPAHPLPPIPDTTPTLGAADRCPSAVSRSQGWRSPGISATPWAALGRRRHTSPPMFEPSPLRVDQSHGLHTRAHPTSSLACQLHSGRALKTCREGATPDRAPHRLPDVSRVQPQKQTTSQMATGLLDHLVGALKERRRDGEAKCLSRLEVDNQLELRGLFDGQVAGLGTIENLVDVGGRTHEHLRKARPI